MLSGKYEILHKRLAGKIDPARMFHDPLYTLALGTDASFYRLIPKLAIRTVDENEVAFILRECSDLKLPVTFRAAGTSLSGQAVTDSVLVIAGSSWKNYSISIEGMEITLEPGLTGGQANRVLMKYGRKIGPDPASINSAMIGGIAANNASGMCCGTAANSYRTVSGIRIILADGTILDTGDSLSRKQFSDSHKEFLNEIEQLSAEAKSDKTLAERITNKYRIKNTTGYSLNALIDYSDPFDIMEHLMIGSEGTLGFISRITYKTVAEHPFKASSLIIFPGIKQACSIIPYLKAAPVSAAELIDRSGMHSVENEEGMPVFIKSLPPEACALLIETVAPGNGELEKNILSIKAIISSVQPNVDVQFTSVKPEYELLWKIRKGLFPAVGAMRRTGTTVIIEDVAFPIERLADATADLKGLLEKHGYREAVIFGHALEGNLHFVFTQDFGSLSEIERYGRLIDDVTGMVVNKYDGSLKAEHGTGRNMAPYVELEWGKEACLLMKKIKRIFDPLNILNPGVILNDDANVHLKDLKPLPAANGIIDKCTECGFCEVSCVSADLTLSPRQRIAVYREMASLEKSGSQPHIAAALQRSYSYAGDATCATDGLCATGCPVRIDTGKLIKDLRHEKNISNRKLAAAIASRMAFITASARMFLSSVNGIHALIGTGAMEKLAGFLRKISFNRLPAWNRYMPAGSARIKQMREGSGRSLKAVYFPSCINRSMGLSRDMKGEKQLSEKFMGLLQKAGFQVILPEGLDSLCCGMAFSSKGFADAGKMKSDELKAALIKASNNGEYPIVCDMSPCLYTMKENIGDELKLYEPVGFIIEHLLPHLHITPLKETITVFPVCSMKKMGMDEKLAELASMCSEKVVVAETNCCGFAGDRGFTYPELNRHGLRNLVSQLPPEVKHGFSTSRTCEIGLSNMTGITYKSIIYLADQVTRPKFQVTGNDGKNDYI